MELIILEQRVVGFKEDIGAALISGLFRLVTDEFTALKLCRAHFTIAIGAHFEARTQEVNSLDTHTIHTYGFLERLGIVFSTGIQLTHGLNHLFLRNATAIVTECHAKVFIDVDLDAFALVHAELINRVVDGLLEQHIDTVLGMGSVAQTTDIHTWTGADMFNIGKMTDTRGIVFGRRRTSKPIGPTGPTPAHSRTTFAYP